MYFLHTTHGFVMSEVIIKMLFCRFKRQRAIQNGIMPGLALVLSGIFGLWSTESLAQEGEIPSQPEIKIADQNNVDLLSGIAHFFVNDIEISGLSHTISSVHNIAGYTNGFERIVGFGDSYDGGVGYTVNLNRPISGGENWDWRPSISAGMASGSESFFVNPDRSLEPAEGGTLVSTDGGQISACGVVPVTTYAAAGAIYTRKDGTQMLLDLTKMRGSGGSNSSALPGACGIVTKITRPDGTTIKIHTKPKWPNSPYAQIQSVTRNDGMQLKYNYTASGELAGVTAINNAFQACDPMADNCALSGNWPQSSYVWSSADSVLTVTDMAGQSTRFTMDSSNRVIGLKPPTSTVDKYSYIYCRRGNESGSYFHPRKGWQFDTTGVPCGSITFVGNSGGPLMHISRVEDRVVQVTADGKIWNYTFPTGTYGPYYLQYRTYHPNGLESMALSTILGAGALLVVGTPKFSANFENTPRNRMINSTVLGQPMETYTYDARGNVISDGLRTTGYDANCTNIKTCNKPNWVKDVAGNRTDFTYDPTHGGILTETSPPDANGIRPQMRFSYVQRYAWFKNPAGIMTRSTEPIWKLATESFCRTTASSGTGCFGGAADEVVITYDYGPDSGPNNLFLRGIVVTADGASLRTCYSYDQYGNKISETQPQANLMSCP